MTRPGSLNLIWRLWRWDICIFEMMHCFVVDSANVVVDRSRFILKRSVIKHHNDETIGFEKHFDYWNITFMSYLITSFRCRRLSQRYCLKKILFSIRQSIVYRRSDSSSATDVIFRVQLNFESCDDTDLWSCHYNHDYWIIIRELEKVVSYLLNMYVYLRYSTLL